jgi:hypothetical protein
MQRTDTNINNLQFKILKLSQIALYPRGKKRTPVLPYSPGVPGLPRTPSVLPGLPESREYGGSTGSPRNIIRVYSIDWYIFVTDLKFYSMFITDDSIEKLLSIQLDHLHLTSEENEKIHTWERLQRVCIYF